MSFSPEDLGFISFYFWGFYIMLMVAIGLIVAFVMFEMFWTPSVARKLRKAKRLGKAPIVPIELEDGTFDIKVVTQVAAEGWVKCDDGSIYVLPRIFPEAQKPELELVELVDAIRNHDLKLPEVDSEQAKEWLKDFGQETMLFLRNWANEKEEVWLSKKKDYIEEISQEEKLKEVAKELFTKKLTLKGEGNPVIPAYAGTMGTVANLKSLATFTYAPETANSPITTDIKVPSGFRRNKIENRFQLPSLDKIQFLWPVALKHIRKVIPFLWQDSQSRAIEIASEMIGLKRNKKKESQWMPVIIILGLGVIIAVIFGLTLMFLN